MKGNQLVRQRPKTRELIKQGFNPVDFHCHTEHSDGDVGVSDLIKKAAKLNIGIAVTDHNEIRGSIKAFNNNQNVFVIPGIELTSSETKDILLYFYDVGGLKDFYGKHVKNYKNYNFGFNLNRLKWNTEELLDLARGYNCIVGLAHPFTLRPKNSFDLLRGNENLMKKIDVVEVLNGQLVSHRNDQAFLWNKQLKKPISGGSDCHSMFEMGRVITAAPGDDVETFLNAIIKKKNLVVGEELNWFSRLKANGVIFKNNIRLTGK
ncbi:PHP domain-containing protein [Nanoarchaeota archaeon]